MIALNEVIELAREAHKGQKDKLDRPYIDAHLQPIADQLAVHGDLAVMGGWLHDILEDTDVTSDELLARGVPAKVVRAVESVSKRPGESYDDLITRAAADPLGRLIKIADNEVNQQSNAELAKTAPETAARLMTKYERARAQLEHHPSHLFVVHGKIEHLTTDAVIVPTDAFVTVEDHWNEVVGSLPHPTRDEFTQGWARLADSAIWFLDVASGGFSQVLERLRQTLHDIKNTQPWQSCGSCSENRRGVPHGRRPLPLVALPVLGVGRGGRGDAKGTVLDQLITSLTAEINQLPFDIVLVTPDPAVYAAAQHARRQLREKLAVDTAAEELAEQAQAGQLALFLGAGVSIPAGLPTWIELVAELAKGVSAEDQAALAELEITDKAQLIEQSQPEGFKERVAKITRTATRPSLTHTLLAGLDVAQVVTTNYDTLFETAMKAAGYAVDVVLPHKSAIGQQRWILKMHGDVDHHEKIVLTRRHMVMYDAANRPSAALLQSLFLTKHLVVVGASMTDPNVVRLAHEVDAYRTEHGHDPRSAYGTVLNAGPSSPAQARLWEDQLEWVDLVAYGLGSGPRALEILLDRVGMFASRNSTWLLDERFSGLLGPEQRDFAAQVRALADNPTLQDETWTPLRDSLSALGALPKDNADASASDVSLTTGSSGASKGEPGEH